MSMPPSGVVHAAVPGASAGTYPSLSAAGAADRAAVPATSAVPIAAPMTATTSSFPAAAAAGGYGAAVAQSVGYGTANARADALAVRAESAGEEGPSQAAPYMGAQVSMPGQEGAQRSKRPIKPNRKFAEDA